MNPSLHADITQRLLRDYEFKDKGAWLREGRCPHCGKCELYTSAERPWVVRCGRESKCGWEGHVKDLYGDLFETWSDRYPVSEASPHAAADAYLVHARGFEIGRLRGCYTQESYVDRELDASTATVRFPLPGGGYWERLIDRPGRFGKKKARFNYGSKHAGHGWAPPGLNLDALDELWLVEGIFDAIALWLHGLPAMALLSCNNYPEHALADLAKRRAGHRPALVWALDGDDAGRSYTRKWVRRARQEGWDCKAAQIPQPSSGGKLDWNDMHQRDRLGESHVKDYRYHGALLIARSPTEKALRIYREKGRAKFPFDFGSRLWWFELDVDKYHKAMEKLEAKDTGLTEDDLKEQALAEANAVAEICTCYPRALYYQRNEVTDESWYYFRVSQPDDRPAIKNTFTGGQIMAAAEFGKRLAGVAPGGLFTGTTAQLLYLMKDQLRGIKTVETIDFQGYSKEHGAYLLGDLAVKDGQLYELNAEDFFEIGRLSLKSLNQSLALQINADRKAYTDAWFGLLWQCFGAKGVVALAFWVGTLFAEQIRATQKSFPFLEVIGEAGSGKSTLLEFLWRLVGRVDYEGFDPTKSTLPGRTRTFGQVANLPIVLIEGDRSSGTDKTHAKQFDWDELKTLYNGRIGRARGVRSAGNETYEPPFRASVVISQNAAVDASDAVLQRIVHMRFTKAGHTVTTKAAAEQLERLPVEHISGLALAAVRREKTILDTLAAYQPGYETMLQNHPELRSMRIAKNHAQMMTLVDALEHVAPITAEQKRAAFDELTAMAVERQKAINADHPLVSEFWDLFDHLNEADNGTEKLNHSRDDALMAVSLPEFLSRAAQHGLRTPPLTDLKRLLPESRSRKFLGYRAVNSAVRIAEGHGVTVKCWVFRRERAASSKPD